MAVERRLTEIAGPVGGKLHTARSRNDQVATDVALFVREAADEAVERIEDLMAALLDAAEAHIDWPLPGLHAPAARAAGLPRAITCSPTSGCSSATASASASSRSQVANLPLGAGALAGVNFDTDRRMVAAELGFDGRRAELARRRRQPRLRPRLDRRRRDLRDAPLAAGRRARAVVQRRSSASSGSRTPGRAAARSCRRRRTRTRPSCCARRRRASSATCRRCTASCTRSR